MTQKPTYFTVGDNPDKTHGKRDEIVVKRVMPNLTMVWALSYEDLIELQTTIRTYFAGENLD